MYTTNKSMKKLFTKNYYFFFFYPLLVIDINKHKITVTQKFISMQTQRLVFPNTYREGGREREGGRGREREIERKREREGERERLYASK